MSVRAGRPRAGWNLGGDRPWNNNASAVAARKKTVSRTNAIALFLSLQFPRRFTY